MLKKARYQLTSCSWKEQQKSFSSYKPTSLSLQLTYCRTLQLFCSTIRFIFHETWLSITEIEFPAFKKLLLLNLTLDSISRLRYFSLTSCATAENSQLKNLKDMKDILEYSQFCLCFVLDFHTCFNLRLSSLARLSKLWMSWQHARKSPRPPVFFKIWTAFCSFCSSAMCNVSRFFVSSWKTLFLFYWTSWKHFSSLVSNLIP